jgi:hypothetical protein
VTWTLFILLQINAIEQMRVIPGHRSEQACVTKLMIELDKAHKVGQKIIEAECRKHR